MKSLRLSIIAATLASLLVNSHAPVVLAQAVTDLQAGALLESAKRLDRNSDDIDAITMAYGQALAAYDQLGNTDKSLEILDTLYAVNRSACRDEAAIRWAEQALERFALPQRDFYLGDKLREYQRWVDVLGDWYHRQGQSAQAMDVYTTALENLATMPPAMDQDLRFDTEATFLRSQLALHPQDSRAATVTRQRLMAAHQRAGVVKEIDGLLSDAIFLNDRANDGSSPSVVEFLQRALDLSRLHNYPAGEVMAATLLGQQALAASNYDQATSYGNLVLTKFNQLEQAERWLADARHVLAQAQQALGNDLEAIKHYSVLLIDMMDSEPNTLIRVNKYDVVVNLISLYEGLGYVASANELAITHSDLLNGLVPRVYRPNQLSLTPIFLPHSLDLSRLCSRNFPEPTPAEPLNLRPIPPAQPIPSYPTPVNRPSAPIVSPE